MNDAIGTDSNAVTRTAASNHLSIENLVKIFGAVRAVDDVSFRVAPGEFLTLLGPSGSGKTTLLRMIGGFEHPDAGRIVLDGRDVEQLPPYKRNIGFVFQKYALFPHMTVFENTAFALQRRRIGRDQILARVSEALDLVGLVEYAERYPRQLSGGQQQRVALARAFVFHPDILLMDEPLGALDKQLREHMQRELRSLQKKIGITTIYVTHDQTEAMTMSDRIAVMNDGHIEQIGDPHDLYERPATEFVAGFVGDSNLLDCTVETFADGIAVVRLDAGGSARCRAEDAAPGPAKLLIRPEKLQLGTAQDAASMNTIPCIVTATAYVGDYTLYDVSIGAAVVAVKKHNREGESLFAAGDTATLSWALGDCSLVR
jgi:spermidine/putrescine ABC transporter ATP-binding subunit